MAQEYKKCQKMMEGAYNNEIESGNMAILEDEAIMNKITAEGTFISNFEAVEAQLAAGAIR